MSLPAYDGDVLEEDGFDKPTLCIDFDGVLHDYHGSPDGAAPALDPDSAAIPGAIDWLYEVGRYFELVILSSFATTDEARMEVATWLSLRGFFGVPYEVTNVKPPAVMYVDDRGYRFEGPGTFPTADEIANAQPWWWMSPELPELEGDDPEQLAATVVGRAAAMEPPMTKTLARIAKAEGGTLEGTDSRLKTEASAAAKIGQAGDDDPQAAAADLKDALRYSLVFPDADYLAGTTATLDALVEKGFSVDRVRNFWAGHLSSDRDGTYYGINAILRAPNGYRFEVQFHTPDSYRTNQAANWELYRQTRDPQTSDFERGAILETMRRNLSNVAAPDGVEDWTYPAAEDDDLVAAARALVAAGRKEPPARVPASHHNAIVGKASARIDELEGKLAALLEPILAAAGVKAAAAFQAKATDHLNAAAYLTAAGDGVTASSTMIAVKPRPEEAERLAADPTLTAETLHVTLAYLGETEGDLEPVAELLRAVAAEVGPLAGEVAGGGFFGSRDAPGPTILLPDVPGLVETRVAVTEALAAGEVEYARNHGFEAHITIAYRGDPSGTMPDDVDFGPATTPARSCGTCGYFDPSFGACRMFDAPVEAADFCDEWTPTGPLDVAGTPLHFDSLLLVRGDIVEYEIPLVGTAPLTAAAGDPTRWTAPAGDEVVDVPALVKGIRAKTDPVRNGFVESTMKPALAKAGLSWDVTNPFTAKVLAQAGSQITEIGKTTQLNAMRIIRESHANGLSIPQTAEAIQEGMKAAAPARAALIARTELAGAVNGGSLAAAQIVSDATGSEYNKVWLTAPGAIYPRHEDYDGLDGQTVPLDEYFSVGDSQLQFPGDPDGDPGEVCNCRCTVVYEDAAGQEVGEGDADSGGGDVPDESGGGGGGSLRSLAQLVPPPGDTISVGSGPFVSSSALSTIDELGLDGQATKDAFATQILGTAADTQSLYSTGGVYTDQRSALHDSIVRAHFEGKTAPAAADRKAFFTAGGGASGKSKAAVFDVKGTTVSTKALDERADTIVVDPDRIKGMLPEYKAMVDAGDPYAAQAAHEESSDIAKLIQQEAYDRGFSVVLDSTGSSDSFAGKIDTAKALGYETRVSMVSVPTNEAIMRSIVRGDSKGRYVRIQPLKKAHAGSSRQLAIWKDSKGLDGWHLYDNTGASPVLVAEGGRGLPPTIYDQAKWEAILAKANE